ncbi:hypothetical protein [Actinophytocola gossypii]|uniref:DUF3040 domain-containing protein n=1 Tax=Actinophytocola gossypii TaxID=2812003 RepID=A0ABT2J8A7_9PSEU|nr:hypothetical protein [Actinophytocola gossypii]MCT2583931.1 hypothetical protein [Actinophytocola gossypii]
MPLKTPDDDRRPADPLAKRFDDDLVGLDPDDPEARAFAEHLERQQRVRPSYTVEGYISGMSEFAGSANRLGGHRRLMATLLVVLILLGVIVAAWDAIVYVLTVFFGPG